MDKQAILKQTEDLVRQKLAEERHAYTPQFVDRFLEEWNGQA